MLVVGAVTDDHPFLVGRRAVLQGAQRQALCRPSSLAVGSAADLGLAVALHGAIDRHAIPVLEHHTGAERSRQPVTDLGDHIGGRARRADHLDQEGQGGHLVRQRDRSCIAGVGVAQAGDEVGQLEMERLVGELVDLRAQNAQSLYGIGAVARPLQRQVRVDTADHRFDPFDQPQSLGSGQRAGREEGSRQRAGRLRCLTFRALCGGSFPRRRWRWKCFRENDPALGDGDPIGGHDLPPYSALTVPLARGSTMMTPPNRRVILPRSTDQQVAKTVTP